MKILIAADMEGITGVVNWDQVMPGRPEYQRFRTLMTGDVNAAIKGAYEGGANEVIVADGHNNGDNILIELLDPRARISQGSPSPFSMVQGVETGVDGVLFVGYHARAGSQEAILDHTWSDASIANLWLNEILVGETGLNAAMAGYFGVPVLMVSGDQTTCAQALDLLGPIEVASVKKASGRMAAECLTPGEAQEKICDAAARAVLSLKNGKRLAPFHVDQPVRVTIEFYRADQADRASVLPEIERLDGRRVEFSAVDMLAAYRGFRAAVSLGRG